MFIIEVAETYKLKMKKRQQKEKRLREKCGYVYSIFRCVLEY